MDIVELATNLIGNLGFPITCVAVLFYMMNKEREEHREEIEKLTTSLNNNTLAITKLITKLDGDTENGI